MDRTFHSKVAWGYWAVLSVSSALLLGCFWFHYMLATALLAAIVIFEIEMLIHTQYIVGADGVLRVETGRFIPNKAIGIQQIVRLRRTSSLAVAPALSARRIEIVYLDGHGQARSISVSPKNADGFVGALVRQNARIVVEN